MADQTEGTIEIEASPEDVMEVIADFDAYPEWSDVETAEILETDDEGRPTAVAFTVSQMGFSAAYTLAYDYAPDHGGVSWTTREADSTIEDIVGEYVLEETGDGTLATYRLQVALGVPVPGLIKRQAEKKIVKSALQGLKRRVEEG